MGELTHSQPFPRGALIGAAALIGFAFLLVFGARTTGLGVSKTDDVEVVASHAVRFEDRADGAVAVYAQGSESPIIVLAPGTNGFVRGVMRGLARERRMHNVGAMEPFELNRTSTGDLRLRDPSTGREIDLQAFGPDNSAAFAAIFAAAASGGR